MYPFCFLLPASLPRADLLPSAAPRPIRPNLPSFDHLTSHPMKLAIWHFRSPQISEQPRLGSSLPSLHFAAPPPACQVDLHLVAPMCQQPARDSTLDNSFQRGNRSFPRQSRSSLSTAASHAFPQQCCMHGQPQEHPQIRASSDCLEPSRWHLGSTCGTQAACICTGCTLSLNPAQMPGFPQAAHVPWRIDPRHRAGLFCPSCVQSYWHAFGLRQNCMRIGALPTTSEGTVFRHDVRLANQDLARWGVAAGQRLALARERRAPFH